MTRPEELGARAARVLSERLAAQRRAVFAACRAQGLDDDTRRAMQRQLTGKDSLAAMSPREIASVLDHLNERQRQADSGEVAGTAIAACRQLQKIAKLLEAQQLPWAYLHRSADRRRPSMCRRLTGKDRIEWADSDGKRAIIVALLRRGNGGQGA